MTRYERPEVDLPVMRDAQQRIVDYGNRWAENPPQEAYSVDTHPERFAPLYTVADALVTFLHDTYDVELVTAVETAADLLHPPSDVIRAVRVRPAKGAPLTFVYTPYPGVSVHAGLLHDFHYPTCGCDACDSTWAGEADDLESLVLAVASGGFSESIEGIVRPRVTYSITSPGRVESGRSRASTDLAKRLHAARPILRNLTNGWDPWPQKPSAPTRKT